MNSKIICYGREDRIHGFTGLYGIIEYSGGGRIIAVNNLASALAALEEFVEQGEGADHAEVWDGDTDVFHPERDQVAHYYRFQELKLGRRYRRGDTPRSGPTGDPISIDWDSARPMGTNPRICDHPPGSPIRNAQGKFNRCYYALCNSSNRRLVGHHTRLVQRLEQFTP